MLCTLRVSHIPLNLDSSALEDMFTMVGNVRSAKIFLDKLSGKSNGTGMVEMSTEQEAADCIHFFKNHASVRVSRPK